jgi:hypothetical protein
MGEPERQRLARRAAGGALLLAAAWPGGPLAFLPPVLRWPLVSAALVAGWRGARAGDHPPPAWLERAAAALVLAVFVLLKVPGLHASWTDDNVYFHMAVRLAGGEWPYRDFFFAHPPLHLAVPALVFRVAGFSVGLAKAIPVVAEGLAGFLLWRALRPSSRVLALAALTLHLLAYQVLMGASDLDGENLATCLLAAALLAASAARPALAGVLAGLATGTVLYAAAGVAAVAVACALRDRRAALRFGAGLAASAATVFGGAWALGGQRFVDGVFAFHADKLPATGRAAVLAAGGAGAALAGWGRNLALDLGGPAAVRFAANHAPLLAGAALGLAVLAAALLRRDGAPRRALLAPGTPEGAAAVGLAGVALFVIQGAVLPERYAFYDVPAIPFLAVLGGAAAATAWRVLAAPASRPAALAGLAAGALAFAAHPLLASAAAARAFPEERRRAGQEVRYAWRDPEALVGVAQVSRALLWSDRRVRGEPEPGWRHALWNKSSAFTSAREIAAAVRDGSSPGETVTGSSMLAPLVALLAERRMAAGELDTNQKRFATGSLGDEELLARALADRVRFVLASPRSHFTEELLERDPRWASRFRRHRVFEDPGLSRAGPVRLVLYRRLDEAGQAPDAPPMPGTPLPGTAGAPGDGPGEPPPP